MKINILGEAGYDWAMLGITLSYNSTIERAKVIAPKLAFGKPGESKFLESISIWLDVTAPIFFWSEADTYRVGSTKQSHSTMHTLGKRLLTNDDFEYIINSSYLDYLNNLIIIRNNARLVKGESLNDHLLGIKNSLPGGFLQRRIWNINYKTLQNIYMQRHDHRLPQWKYFCEEILAHIEHPEFIRKEV